MNSIETQIPGVCYFLRLPREIRDVIYEMLLTTPYCMHFISKPSSVAQKLVFNLQTAILLVNKQISAEATRVLYEENIFIIFKTSGIDLLLNDIPAFRRLSEDKVTDPVLRAEVRVTKNDQNVETSAPETLTSPPGTLITTLEGLQSLIRALWILKQRGALRYDQIISRKDLSLTLNFNFKAGSHYRVPSERVIRPWDTMTGFRQLVLTGDVNDYMREHLEKSNLEGPLPNVVTAHLTDYSSLAEQEFKRENYNAAQWWCAVLQDYSIYVSNSRLHWSGDRTRKTDDPLWGVLRRSYFMRSETEVMLMKMHLRQLEYTTAITHIGVVWSDADLKQWEYQQYGYALTPIMQIKLRMAACLAQTACGKIIAGMEDLSGAVRTILFRTHPNSLNIVMGQKELTKDLKLTVDNELIRLKFIWRCGREMPLSSTRRKGREWKVGVVQRSFWEWMELSEDFEVA